MASCQTTSWSGISPQVRLTVTESASTGGNSTLSWVYEYYAKSAAVTSVNKAWSVTIAGTKVSSGSFDINGKTGWHTISSGTKTINKTTSKQTISFSCSFSFNLTWSGVYCSTRTASGSISVAAKTKYTISYNANGGSGAPSSQSKWHGTAITLSTTKPTRTGYAFQGWGTSSSATTAAYAAGASYSGNASVTLYAVWKANTYTVKFNANGGSGAPGNQTKTYGKTLTLSSTKPTRTNYNFLGWGTSASATTAKYSAGGSYTANAAITLYAVWELAYIKPRITNVSVSRCDANGNVSDGGTYALVAFNWACDQTLTSITISWESSSSNGSTTVAASGTSGTVNTVVGNGTLSTESTYAVQICVTDASDESYAFGTVHGMHFAIDVLAGGSGIAFGKPSELENVADINFQTRFHAGLLYMVLEPETDLNTVLTPNFYVGANVRNNNYVNCPITTGTFTLIVESGGEDGQVRQSLVACSKDISRTFERYYYSSAWGEWICTSDYAGTVLWSGAWYMSSGHTVELAEPISQQRTGICLVFSRYSSSTAQNYHFNTFFIPKYQIATHSGCGCQFMMSTDGSFGVVASKYLYIHDTTIVGSDANQSTGSANGITYANNGFVLRYVIGV